MLGRMGHPLFLGYVLLIAGAAAFLLPLLNIPGGHGHLVPQYGDIIAICAFVATVVIAMFSILPNLRSMAEISRSTHYSELDKMYMEILSMAIDMPYLRNPRTLAKLPLDDDGRQRYETYAFVVWNFLETIHDRCAEYPALKDTWGPVIGAELEIHRQWFEDQTIPYQSKANPKFCLQFCDFIWRVYCDRGCSTLGTAAEADAWKIASWSYRPESVILADPDNACRLWPPESAPANDAAATARVAVPASVSLAGPGPERKGTVRRRTRQSA